MSFESRKGTCFAFGFTSALITFPRADNDKLIFMATIMVRMENDVLKTSKIHGDPKRMNVFPLEFDLRATQGFQALVSALLLNTLIAIPRANNDKLMFRVKITAKEENVALKQVQKYRTIQNRLSLFS